jgi:hypothetical protein
LSAPRWPAIAAGRLSPVSSPSSQHGTSAVNNARDLRIAIPARKTGEILGDGRGCEMEGHGSIHLIILLITWLSMVAW